MEKKLYDRNFLYAIKSTGTLVILGNGFDLHYGRLTNYNDFYYFLSSYISNDYEGFCNEYLDHLDQNSKIDIMCFSAKPGHLSRQL